MGCVLPPATCGPLGKIHFLEKTWERRAAVMRPRLLSWREVEPRFQIPSPVCGAFSLVMVEACVYFCCQESAMFISLNSWLQTTETDSHGPKRKLLEEYRIASRTRKEAGTRLRREGRDGGTAGSCLEPFGRVRLCPRDRHPVLTLSTLALAIRPWCHK